MMRLIYLSPDNLQNAIFIKDFAFNFPEKGNSIVVHAPFGKGIQDTRFVTKRISSVMSEAMVVNNPFSGDQRNIFQKRSEGISLNGEYLAAQLQLVPALVLNPIMAMGEAAEIGDPLVMMEEIRKALPITEVMVFTRNSRSPLAMQKPIIRAEADVAEWLTAYEEERNALETALRLAPAQLVSPLNFGK